MLRGYLSHDWLTDVFNNTKDKNVLMFWRNREACIKEPASPSIILYVVLGITKITW